MEWKMIKPSITWDFDAFQGRSHVNLHEESKGLLPSCTLSCMLPNYQKESHGHLSSATPSSSGTTATAGASLDSGSSGIIPAINLKEICQKREFIVGDFEGPERQQCYSERYVDASCTAKAPPPPPPPPPPLPPSAAVTVLPYSERTFAQEKRTHPLDQSSPLISKGLTVASSNDDPVNQKIKQQRTTFAAPVMDHPVLRCQIDGCKEDLSKAKKDYHRRHKVCEMHSKAPGVIKSGLEQRFCQQCSRFHVVGEFDNTKRSCRRRLEGHNRRRRKSNNYQGTASSFSVGSIFQLGHDKLLLNHLMQHHQPEMPLPRMQFYQNNEGMLRRAVGWPVAGFQEEEQQQQGVAMASLPADFNEINSRLRAVLNYGQINKGSSSSSLSLLGLQQQEEAFSFLGKALSLCATTNGSTCALSLLSPHALPEPVIPDQVTLDEKLPNHLNYPPNHHHQNLTLASVGLISSDHSMVHPQSALPLANQPTSLALSMGKSDVSSGIKEEFYQKQVPLAAPSPCNYNNMALFPSLAPSNPFLPRLLHEAAANHHHYQQLDTAMEVNAQHLQPPQGFANNF